VHQLPEDARGDADAILLGAAAGTRGCGTWPGWPRRSESALPGPTPPTMMMMMTGCRPQPAAGQEQKRVH
jgi:hypothetical protein